MHPGWRWNYLLGRWFLAELGCKRCTLVGDLDLVVVLVLPLGGSKGDGWGLYVWIWDESPASRPAVFWSTIKVKGEGDRVGEVVSGEGDGVLANGDTGMLWMDLRRCGDFTLANLCFKPCKDPGRCWQTWPECKRIVKLCLVW